MAARKAADALQAVLKQVAVGDLTASASTRRRLEGAVAALETIATPPPADVPVDGDSPEVVPLRYGLVATYVLREKPPPPPPVCREREPELVSPWPPEDWAPEP